MYAPRQSKITPGPSSGSSKPLPPATRAYFEPRLGRDLGDVRIHDTPKAAHMAQSIGARAFTLRSNIFFDAGEFQPQSHEGKQVLAHELVHVVQQTQAVPSSLPVTPTAPRIMRLGSEPAVDRVEQEADHYGKKLSRTKDQEAAITKLFQHPKFRELWDWLGSCNGDEDLGPIKIRVRRTFEDGAQQYGRFKPSKALLTINPAMLDVRKNPMELVDTIIHELIHAASWAMREGKCPQHEELPLGLTGTGLEQNDPDVWSEDESKDLLRLEQSVGGVVEDIRGTKAELERFEEFGPSASDACRGFIDIRAPSQTLINEIIGDVSTSTTLDEELEFGGATRTMVNEILREELRRANEGLPSGTYDEVLARAPLLRGFIECRNEVCRKPLKRRRIKHCFKKVLAGHQRQARTDREG